jgi:hypothetical protein
MSEIVEYSPTEAALTDLRDRFKNVVFDVTTTKGDKEARAARMELVGLRTSLEKKRKEIKEPALEHCRMIDAEAKRITAEIVALEKPIDDQIKAEELRKAAEKAAKEEAERQRIANLQERIAEIRGAVAAAAMGCSPALVLEHIGDIERIAIDESFEDFQPLAQAAKDETLNKLRQIHAQAVEREAEAARLAAEREELARLRKEQEERAAQERARIAAEQKAEAERIAQERAKHEAELKAQREAQEAELAQQRAKQAESDRIAREQREAEERRIAEQRAEVQRQADELARQQREREEATRAEQAAKEVVALPVETVTIPKAEYERLLRRDEWLDCLEAAGVDNWSGIEEAIRIRKEEDEEQAA